jgi:hypothetical protein
MFGIFNKPSRKKDLKAVKGFLIDHFQQLHNAKDRIPQDVFDVSAFFITEAIQLFDSIDILTRKNHFRGCLPIARTIMEISINFQYIYKQDIEKRAKNFKLDSMLEMKRKGDSVADESVNNPAYQEYMSKIADELKDYKKVKKTVYEKAKETNMESSYISTYRRLSEYVHSGYQPVRDFDEKGPYNDFLKRVVYSDTVMFIMMGLKSMCEQYDLDGGFMVIDDPGYKGIIFFSTNSKKEEERNKAYQESKKR